MTALPITEHGLPIDEAFAVPVTEAQLQRAAVTLTDHGLLVEIVDTIGRRPHPRRPSRRQGEPDVPLAGG